jgi:hypothetical protein
MTSGALADFLDDAAADFFSADEADGAQVGLALDDGQPGEGVIEHGGGGHENGIVERDVNGIAEKKFAEFALAEIAAGILRSDGDAGDYVKDVVAVKYSPETLLIVEDQKLASGTLLEGPESFGKNGVFVERLGGKRIDKRGEGLVFEKRLGERQAAPKIAGASGESLEKNVAKRREGTGHLFEQGAADLSDTNGGASANAGFMGAIPDEGFFSEKVAFAENGDEFGFGGFWRRFEDLNFAFLDDAEGARLLTLAVDEIAGAIVGVRELLGRIGAEETKIARKEEVPSPVLSDFNAAGPVGEFQKIDTAPHEPG